MTLLLALLCWVVPAEARPLVHVDPRPPGTLPPVCATPRLLPDLLPSPLLPAVSPSASEGKSDREAIEGVASTRSSDNFAIKWGEVSGVDEDTVAALLDAFEASLVVETATMGLPVPVGSDRYLFNVYIEDTGLVWDDGSTRFELSGSGAGAYFYSDPEGFPMIVVSQGALVDLDYAGMVAAHELFHAVQAATGAYPYAGRSAWYWEATASWAAGEVFPERTDYAAFLFGFVLLPWLPVDFFDYPDDGLLQEYHQYGAFILPRFISELAADWTVVADSWRQPDPDGDPLRALDAGLAGWDTEVSTAVADMAAHLAVWDFAHGDAYAEAVAEQEPLWPEGAALVADIGTGGSAGWQAVIDEQTPQRLGYNLLAIERTVGEATRVDFDGVIQGSEGSPVRWQLRLVSAIDPPQYAVVEVEDGEASVVISEDDPAARLWLVASPSTEDRVDGERFPWSYRVGPAAAGDTGDTGDRATGGGGLPREERGACGCSGGPASGGLLVALLAVPWRRRRGVRAASSAR